MAPAKTRILIVEDNYLIAQIFQRVLSNYETYMVDSGENALTVLSHCRFDLLILDLNLGKVSGIDVLRHVRAHPELHSNLRVVVVSADSSLYGTARRIGIDEWLSKPFDINDLLKTIQQALQTPEYAI